MKIKCQIKWIGADGKPTPDTNDAVMMAHVRDFRACTMKKRSMWQLPRNKRQEKAEETKRSIEQKKFKDGKLHRLNPLTSLPEYTEEIVQSFPICAAHYAKVNNSLRYPVGAWSFTNLNSEDK